LAKRETFRAAFKGFDFNKVARFTEEDVVRLLGDAGIVCHRGKIEAVINNAKRAGDLVRREGSLFDIFWRYAAIGEPLSGAPMASPSAEAVALSKDLKKWGGSSLGPPPPKLSCKQRASSMIIAKGALSGKR